MKLPAEAHLGIHGFPRLPWDGVVGDQGLPGYCPHGCAEFLPWHRPYLALYEVSYLKTMFESQLPC